MARLRVRFKFNPGRHGAPLDKLGEFAIQSEKFLRALTNDLGERAKKGEWIADNFQDGSAVWDNSYANRVAGDVAAKSNVVLRMISGGQSLEAVNHGLIGYGTITEFSRIGEAMAPDEHFEMGLYDNDTDVEPSEWKEVAYGQTAEIRQLLNAPFVSYGSVQGVMHRWTMEGEKSFTIRDISTGILIKCAYQEILHNKVHEATENPNSVLIVYGDMKWDRTTNLVIEVAASDLETARTLTDAEFHGLFGAAPDYVGSMTSTEYIEWLRGDGE